MIKSSQMNQIKLRINNLLLLLMINNNDFKYLFDCFHFNLKIGSL